MYKDHTQVVLEEGKGYRMLLKSEILKEPILLFLCNSSCRKQHHFFIWNLIRACHPLSFLLKEEKEEWKHTTIVTMNNNHTSILQVEARRIRIVNESQVKKLTWRKSLYSQLKKEGRRGSIAEREMRGYTLSNASSLSAFKVNSYKKCNSSVRRGFLIEWIF